MRDYESHCLNTIDIVGSDSVASIFNRWQLYIYTYHQILKGYEETPVTQIANLAWEQAFIGASNQINIRNMHC